MFFADIQKKRASDNQTVENWSQYWGGGFAEQKANFICDNSKPLLPGMYDAAMNEYLLHYMARLVALETMLKSYE